MLLRLVIEVSYYLKSPWLAFPGFTREREREYDTKFPFFSTKQDDSDFVLLPCKEKVQEKVDKLLLPKKGLIKK